MDKLEPGVITKVEFIRAIDGDTIEFEIKRSFHIRLRDIDTYEKRTAIGNEAKIFVQNLLSNAGEILVFIPSNDPVKLVDINSFNRLVGEVIVDGVNLADLLRESGYEKKK